MRLSWCLTPYPNQESRQSGIKMLEKLEMIDKRIQELSKKVDEVILSR